MKTFFEPVQGMAGIEEIKKSFRRLGHDVMVSTRGAVSNPGRDY